MRSRVRSATVLIPLPNGERVLVHRRDVEAIRGDILLTGNVFLRRDSGSDVYERVDPASVESAEMTPGARRVVGDD